VRWLNRRVAGGRSRGAEGCAVSLLEADAFKVLSGVGRQGEKEPQEAFRCTGSSDVKMSVWGGGVYAVLERDREGYNSKVR
jgi:hypothetical protein